MRTFILIKCFSVLLMMCTTGMTVYMVDPEGVSLMEDVVGSYELHSIKNLIKNTSQDIKDHFNTILRNNSLKESFREFKVQSQAHSHQIQDSVNGLKKDLKLIRGEVEAKDSFTDQREERLLDRIAEKFSDVKSSLLNNFSDLWNSIGDVVKASSSILASDCSDLYKLGYNASGSYWLQKFGRKVLCDMETDGGGWLVVQRRANVEKQVDFNQDWSSYKMGFGNLDTEFWIGNDVLHILTNQKVYQMLIEMEDYEKGFFYASYSSFGVGNESSHYVLDIGNYMGNCSDAFAYHHGQKFTTKDRDSDAYEGGNCASYFSGGWWHDRCYDAHLNGIYPEPPNRDNASYITWWSKGEGEEKIPLVLTNVLIKIRPAEFAKFSS